MFIYCNLFIAVTSLVLNHNAVGKSWYRYEPSERSDHRIIFEDYRDTRYNDNDFVELEHHDDHRVGHKHPRDWNPDRIWFPDSDNENRDVTTR